MLNLDPSHNSLAAIFDRAQSLFLSYFVKTRDTRQIHRKNNFLSQIPNLISLLPKRPSPVPGTFSISSPGIIVPLNVGILFPGV